MVIDFTTRQPKQDGEPEKPPDTAGAILDNTETRRLVLERPDYFNKCYHRKMQIDDVQRTVKCGECGIWLDPVWCLRELFYYYEKRVDERIFYIKEAEKKEQEARKRKAERKQKPREWMQQRRAESLERAAFNEYQAKLLLIRAERQKATAEKLLQALGEPPSINAGDPVEGIVAPRPRA